VSRARACSPGAAVTAVNAASVRSGRPGSAAGGSTYAWTTSRPVRRPVLRSTTVTPRVPSSDGARAGASAAADSYAHVV